MDHKPVLVSWNHADKLLQPVIKLRDFLKCRRGNNSTVVNSSHRSSHRSRQPARGLDGGTNIAPVCVEPFPISERPLETIGSRIPFLLVVHFIGIRSLGDARSHARSHEDSASLGAVATYGLVSDQSPSAFLESPSPARFSEKAIIPYFD